MTSSEGVCAYLRRTASPLVAILCFVFSLLSLQADRIYTVRRYDTLSGVARDHGLSLAELARHNGISPTTKVRAGQRLRIPDTFPPRESKATLPSSVREAIRRAKVKRGQWEHVVIHHSGTPNGTVRAMDRYHREQRHMENGLAYHFVIGNGQGMPDGQIAVGNRWTQQLDGGHLASESLNHVSIGICLVGNFDKESPTPKQLQSLRLLVDALLERCDLPSSALKTHQQINPVFTRCPGSHFPTRFLRQNLQAHN